MNSEPTVPLSPVRRRALGLLQWREHWTLSLRGRLSVLLLGLVLVVAAHRTLYPFLAVNHPLRGEVLVVEGWIPVHTVHLAAAEFNRGHYRRVLIVRALVEGELGVLHGQSAADYTAELLRRCGVPREAVDTVLFPGSNRDRTLHSAVEARKWLERKGEPVKSLDVVTSGPHARRSRLIYQRAFGRSARVGVIALTDPTYDAKHWWRSSEGVREVLGEAPAYLYARLCFWN